MLNIKAGAIYDNFSYDEINEILKALEYCYHISRNDNLVPLINYFRSALEYHH